MKTEPQPSISAQQKMRDHHIETVKKIAKQIPRLRW
jgi:hypothetical protein